MSGFRALLATTRGRIILMGFVVVLVAGQQLVSRATAAPPKAELRTAPVTLGSVTQTVAISGSLNPSATYRLSFRTNGRLSLILVAIGDQVTAGHPLARLDTSDLQTALGTAQANYASAKARYDQTLAGADPDAVADAQRAFDRVQTSYISAKSNLQSNFTGMQVDLRTYVDKIVALKDQLTKIQGDLQYIAQPIGTPITPNPATTEPLFTPKPTPNTSETDAKAAVNSMNKAELARNTAGAYANDILAPALGEFVSAYNNLTRAIAAFDAAAAASADTKEASAFFQNAQSTYSAAQSRLTNAIETVSSQLTSSQTDVSSALSTLQGGGSRNDPNLDQARADLQVAQTTFVGASQAATSAKLKITAAATALGTATEMVATSYVSTQQAVQRAAATPKPADVMSAYASFLSSQNSLANAQTNLENATLRAPAPGTIATIAAQIGENVTGVVMTMANTATIQLRGTIGEADVAKLKIGQVATITVDAVGAANRMTGRVNSIDPVATIQQGVPVYGVDVVVDIPAPGVRPGMSGTAAVIIASHQGVLTVPNLSIRSQGTRRYVQVLRNGEVVDADVTFGLSNDTATEVTAGLTAQDVVVLPQPRATTSTAPRPGGFPGPGGGVQIR